MYKLFSKFYCLIRQRMLKFYVNLPKHSLRRFALQENSKKSAQRNGARCYSVYLEFCSVSCKANAKRAPSLHLDKLRLAETR